MIDTRVRVFRLDERLRTPASDSYENIAVHIVARKKKKKLEIISVLVSLTYYVYLI